MKKIMQKLRALVGRRDPYDVGPAGNFDDTRGFEPDNCPGCGSDGMNGIQCPLCCGGYYSPGSTYCDLCDHFDECAGAAS